MASTYFHRATAFVVLAFLSSFSAAGPNLPQPPIPDKTFTSPNSVLSNVSRDSQAGQSSQRNVYRNVAYYVVSYSLLSGTALMCTNGDAELGDLCSQPSATRYSCRQAYPRAVRFCQRSSGIGGSVSDRQLV